MAGSDAPYATAALMLGAGLTLAMASIATNPVVPDAARPVPSVVVTPVPADRNAFAPIRTAALALRLPTGQPPTGWDLRDAVRRPGPVPADVVALWARNPGAEAALRAARARPGLQAYPVPLRLDAPSPPLSQIGALARLGLVGFRMRVARGDVAGATTALADVVHLGRRLATTPGGSIVMQHVGRTMVDQAAEALAAERPRVLAWPAPALAALASGLEQARGGPEPTVGALMAAERDALLAALAAPDTPAAASLLQELGPLPTRASPYLAPDVRKWWDATTEAIDGRDQARLAMIQGRLFPEDVLRVVVTIAFHPIHELARLIAAARVPSTAQLPVWRTRARLDAMRVLVASERYRRRHGRAPASLEALVPAYLPAVPLDPYTTRAPLGFEAGKLWARGLDAGASPLPLLPLPTPSPTPRPAASQAPAPDSATTRAASPPPPRR